MTTLACRRCGADGKERFVGTVRMMIHVKPSIDHAFLPPVKKLAPLTELEKRALYGDR